MVADHTEANRKLQTVGGQESKDISSRMTQEGRATYSQLSSLSGASFDGAYAADMVQHHQQDLAAFEKEAKYEKDAAVRRFAETFPTLREHLQLAQ